MHQFIQSLGTPNPFWSSLENDLIHWKHWQVLSSLQSISDPLVVLNLFRIQEKDRDTSVVGSGCSAGSMDVALTGSRRLKKIKFYGDTARFCIIFTNIFWIRYYWVINIVWLWSALGFSDIGSGLLRDHSYTNILREGGVIEQFITLVPNVLQ